MAVGDVKKAFAQVSTDRKIDSKDIDTVLTAVGNISVDEEKALKAEGDKFAGMMDPAAKAKFKEKLGEVSTLRTQAAQINRRVEMSAASLNADVKARLQPGAATKTFGGSAIPEAVKKVVSDALAKGAVAYDVRELKPDPIYDGSHGEPEMTIEGKYNPYSQDQQAVDSMAFDYTELTPAKIAADMATPQEIWVQKGYTGTGNAQQATFEKQTIPGNGRITELYDEASWSQTKARGPGGQKYASNFAILADGSFHAVPASRRTSAEPWRILTTASLGRGKQMLFNGHIHMEKGVVTYIGMSGRLCKQAEKGAKFVDPIELVKAWGFQTSPGLKVTNEG